MKFRIPIMQRTPLITRKPIVFRAPFLKRHAIYQRTAIHKYFASDIGCSIGSRDCSKLLFGKPQNSHSKRILFRFKSSDTIDWEQQVEYAKTAQERGQLIRVVTDVLLPESFIYAIGYASQNTVQFSINVLTNREISTELRRNIKACKDSGIYTVVLLHSILPTVIHTYDILLIFHSLEYICSHICIKFFEAYPKKVQRSSKNCLVAGHRIPKKYMTFKGGHLQCHPEYVEQFTKQIMDYAVPHKIKCTVCNEQKCYWEDIHGTN